MLSSEGRLAGRSEGTWRSSKGSVSAGGSGRTPGRKDAGVPVGKAPGCELPRVGAHVQGAGSVPRPVLGALGQGTCFHIAWLGPSLGELLAAPGSPRESLGGAYGKVPAACSRQVLPNPGGPDGRKRAPQTADCSTGPGW